MELGNRLKKLREELGMSQAKLAAKTGIPVSTLRFWEYGLRTPLLDATLRVAEALGVSLDELAGRAESRPAQERNGE